MVRRILGLMPLPWFSLPHIDLTAIQATQAAKPQRTQIDQELVIEWQKQEATLSPHRVLRFTEGVKASYGPTTVYADELTLYLDEDQKHGDARGHVRLEDPAGKATASSFTFDWNKKTGSVTLAHIEVAEVKLDARQVDVQPGRWDIYDWSGTNWVDYKPIYQMSSGHAIIEPGQHLTIEKPRLRVFGARVASFPTYNMSMDRRGGGGIGLPAFGYRRGAGLSANWTPTMLVSRNDALTGNVSGSQKYPPSYNALVAHSFLSAERSDAPIVPRSEFDERFNSSYFENINVRSIENDANYVRSSRSTASVGFYRNASTSDRAENALFTIPYDFAYERSGASEDLGYYGQIRYQTLRRRHEAEHSRFVFTGISNRRPIEISNGLLAHIRADANAFVGGTSFGWARGSVGLTYHPKPYFVLATSAFIGGQTGNSLFPDDELFARAGYTNRIDLNFGPARFGYLNRYDAVRHQLYDHEMSFIQVIGGIEAYMVYRRFPGDYHFGVRMRLNNFMDVVRSRKPSRPKPPP